MKSLRSRRHTPLLGLLFLFSCTIRFSESNTTPDFTYPASTIQATATTSTYQHSTDVPTANPSISASASTTIRSTSTDVTRNTNVLSVSQITSSNGLTSSLTTTETLPSSSSGSRSHSSVNLPHTITPSTSVSSTDPLDTREPISNQPETNQENTDERPPSSQSVAETDSTLPSTSSVPIKSLPPDTPTNVDTTSLSTSNSIPTGTMNQTDPTTITHEALINDVHVEKKLKNGLYRIKLAEIITDQFNGGINKHLDTTDSDGNYMPPPRNTNEHAIANGGKINIIDLYPLKVEDFNPIIKNSNEKLIREKSIYLEDPSTHRQDKSEDEQNAFPNSLDVLLFKSRSSGPDIKIPSVNREKGEISDFTGKLLQEKDGVITEIEKKFRLDEFEQSTSLPPSTPSLAPMTTTSSQSTTTTTTTTRAPLSFPGTTSKPLQASVLRPLKPKLMVNHQIQFIDRRVKKSFEFPLHHEAARFGFANTKFNSDAAKLDTGESRLSDAHPEFSTTKFYNSKELHSEMLQRRKSSTIQSASYNQPPPPSSHASPPAMDTTTTLSTTVAPTPTVDSTKAVLIEKTETRGPTTTNASSVSRASSARTKALKRVKVALQKSIGPQVAMQFVEREQKSSTDASTNEEKSSASLSLSAVSNDKIEIDSTPATIQATTYDDAKTRTTRGKDGINSTPTTTVTSTATQWQSSSSSSSSSPSYTTVNANEHSTSPTKNSKSKPISRPRILSRLQEKINSLECDIQSLTQESHLWRGNETHELMLPIVTPESCKSSNDCTPIRISWEGSAEIQSGDVLLVEINDAMLYPTYQTKVNSGHTTQVYQVTRSGHEHCDVTEGILLDITPLVVDGRKLVTLYDKDLTEGINLLIVVSELWGTQCIRLKVTMKSDNCGENADCSGKGVCYSNESMEGYECQCCAGFTGSHCEEIDACSPSPCTNNGICVDLSQGHEGNAYQCLCPYGYTGKNCQYESDPCNPAECMNGGSCVGNSSHFICDCAPGYTGPLCQHNLNECESSPCVHGICVDQEDGFRCFCQPGFAGELCNFEYNECESNPCLNGAECIDQIGSFECRCSKGYIGSRCEIKVDFCANKPCPEGHQCIDHGDDFSCECPGGRNGPDCNQIPRTQCNVNPCTHGGTCWSSGDSFYCACRPGFTGAMCEDEFVVETVVSSSEFMVDDTSARNFNDKAFGSVVLKSPIELHNAYIAAGVLAAAIFIVAVVVTICHCKVNQTYRKFSTRTTPFFPILGFGRRGKAQKSHKHWLSGKAGSGGSSSSGSSNCNPLKSGRGHVPSTGSHQYHSHSTTGLQQPPQQIHERPFQRHLAMNLENDMYYTVDFSEHSQHSPLIQ